MKDHRKKSELNYADSGVSVEKGDAFVDALKPLAAKATRIGQLGSIGAFSGLFDIGKLNYKDPIIVASTDGVGTKLIVALEYDRHEQIGIDLVAMCVNDLVVQGAEPLFFLDYFAMGNLDPTVGKSVLSGVVDGCQQAGASLLGGETAEMPGLYSEGHYDLAGFAVGIVERDKIVDGSKVSQGDIILGLSSSGFHANGFSLIRKIRALVGNKPGAPSVEELLCPTRIYVKSILSIVKSYRIHAISHITGGGLTNNIPRVLPKGLCARIQIDSWPLPKIFRWLAESGPVEEAEMLRTFNCGIGMVLIVPPESAKNISSALTKLGEEVHFIGEIARQKGSVSFLGRLLD
ncbi:MAG: phosphoribosylformylglycinamidine cyclo-ligase [Pseudomonadota bacterium]|nr:phosphoribosylformylglycinamidine cyclo-ligase [Pseudomonadota bacterium]